MRLATMDGLLSRDSIVSDADVALLRGCHEISISPDGELDDGADLVAAHLEECRRCGLEESIYSDIKASLARRPTT